MNIIVLFMVSVMVVVLWWLVLQRIASKPWLEQGAAVDARTFTSSGYSRYVASKLALWVFMVVITSLFLLFVTAYHMRMHLGDWQPLQEPRMLWFNTALLLCASIALQLSRRAIEGGNAGLYLLSFVAGGAFAIAFLLAQWWVWRGLVASGYLVADNPANSFFYLLTGLHAVHLAGGLIIWCRATLRMANGADISRIKLSVELCTLYWHYLLLLWLGLFALLLST